MTKQVKSTLILLFCAFLWGSTFVAQSAGMEYIEPFTYLCCRSVIGCAFLSVFMPLFDSLRKTNRAKLKLNHRKLMIAGLACGVVLFTASAFQQFGICYTTVGKSGFITAMYILLVPVLGLFLRKKVPPIVWGCIAIAVVGLYLLCINEALSVNIGDFLTLICAVCFSVHILVIDHFDMVDGIRLSRMQFAVTAILSAIAMFIFEQPSWSAIVTCWGPILYAGILSSGVAYTLQIIGQQGANPTVASIAMSMESVFSVLCGWLILNEGLSARELIGCILMFAAIILCQIPIPSKKKKTIA
ncbi:MAG: DMT family transporter [Ruminococcaceae bacterium]|nr:DMT family transporter [Oscillospiraceae bacterium]